MIKYNKNKISIKKQCELLGIARSTYYYKPKPEKPENILLMKIIDKIHLDHVAWGSRKIRDYLNNNGWKVNRKRIQRLMNKMQIQAIYPKKNLSRPNASHKKYPYLLNSIQINQPNQVWCSDITYIPLKNSYIYCVAIMDWYSKKILSCELSITPDKYFCISALERAIRLFGKPEVLNTDQGSQFTSNDFTNILLENDIQISMNSKGRALDNIAIERFWRTLKYEEVYLKDYSSISDAQKQISDYINQYCQIRPHATLDGKTPDMKYYTKGFDQEKSA